MSLYRKLLNLRIKRLSFYVVAVIVIITIRYLKLEESKAIHIQVRKDNFQVPDKVAMPRDEVHIFYTGEYRVDNDNMFMNWSSASRNINMAYYPALGLYSSYDTRVIDTHMKQIRSAGIGVVVVSWLPQHFPTAPPMFFIMRYANMYGLKVTIHVQDFEGRQIVDVQGQIAYFFDTFGPNPAVYKVKTTRSTKPLPLIYICKSDKIPHSHWQMILDPNSKHTFRNTQYDAIYIGMAETEIDPYIIEASGFDGFYTYLSSTYYSHVSMWYNWPHLQDLALERNLIFIPTVSPGYDDRSVNRTKIHPMTDRKKGLYYETAWKRAIYSRSKVVAINSFNEWFKGTQIEPAVSHKGYDDYLPAEPDIYLYLTLKWVREFAIRLYIRSQ